MIVPIAFKVGKTTTVPDVGASYQITVSLGSTDAVAVSVCKGDISHCVILPPETGATGAGLIVNVTEVLFKEGQPLSASA